MLSDSTVYILAPIHGIFVFIAEYYNYCCCHGSSDELVELKSEIPRKGLSAVFEMFPNGKYKLDQHKCFAFFDKFIGKMGGEVNDSHNYIYHDDDDVHFSLRWGLQEKSLANQSIAFGLEILRDLVNEKLFMSYVKHLGLEPLTDSQIRAQINPPPPPTIPQSKVSKRLKESGKIKSISSYFKPLNK